MLRVTWDACCNSIIITNKICIVDVSICICIVAKTTITQLHNFEFLIPYLVVVEWIVSVHEGYIVDVFVKLVGNALAQFDVLDTIIQIVFAVLHNCFDTAR